MTYIEILLIAIGLSMDCFSVSFTAGAVQKLRWKQIFIVAVVFGFFHLFMPLLGWLLGYKIVELIQSFDHWISFMLLAFIGGKMIYDGVKNTEEHSFDILKAKTLLLMAFATTVDALAVGIGLGCMDVEIVFSSFCIGISALIFSILGASLGKFCAKWIKTRYAEILGGSILLVIGAKILLEHLLR